MVAQQAAITAAFGGRTPVARPNSVVQRVGFGPETTYGLEIEFTNRWLSLLTEADGKGKGIAKWPVQANQIFQGSPAMTVSGDAGRAGTVMEVESRVFEQASWNRDQVHREASAIMARSNEIVSSYREQHPSSVKSEESKLVNKVWKTDKAQGWDLVADGQPFFDAFSQLAEADLDDVQLRIRNDLVAITKGRKEKANASLQITTLGRKGREHREALKGVSGAIEAQNLSTFGKESVPAQVQRKTTGYVGHLLNQLRPDGRFNPQILEDLEVLLECACKIVLFAEVGIEGHQFGTIKNMPHVLPRRHVKPPDKGFASALRINPQLYNTEVNRLRKRLGATPVTNDPIARDVLLMLARGSGVKANTKFERRKERWERENNPTPFGLWTVEGGVPTLEDEIIDKANKDKPEDWTAHEIRNFGWSMGITAKQMAQYLKVMKHYATGG